MKPILPTVSMCSRSRQKGAALIVVLAMLVLLLGILGAFLSRSGTNRETSASSASLTAVDLLASVAIDQVVGDLKQEIEDGSEAPYDPPNGGDTLYLPETPQNAIPQLRLRGLTAGNLIGSGMENLISVSGNGSLTPTDEPSRNGRSITPERWNKPLLMKRTASNGSNDSPPANFPTPQWILVARDGTSPANLTEARWSADMTNRKTVIGRYAYVVYNQGGLLDANIAGYPQSAANPVDLDGDGTDDITNPARFKPSTAYADLTIPEIGLTQAQINTLIEDWRNEATFAAPDPATEYFKLNLQNDSGFLSTSNKSAPGGATDRMFIGRRHLIDFFKDKLDLNNSAGLDALQYFTTFSRSLNRPTFYRMQGQNNSLPNYNNLAPAINPYSSDSNTWGWQWTEFSGRGNSASGNEARINPIFPAVTMAGSGERIDGSRFSAGDPVVNKRFPLDRLLWITYKGPSATLPATDPLIPALEAEGITRDFLAQGTAQNIEKAFGLRWTPGPGPNGLGGYWTYDAHSVDDPIDLLENVAAQNREPDFFELLKATVDAGAIGRAREGFLASSTANRNNAFIDGILRDSSINNHIMQLGANLIDQAHSENYPTHIVLPLQNGTVRARSFWGIVDLPYFYGSTYGPVLAAAPVPALVKGAINLPERGPHLSDIVDGTIQNFGISAQTGATILMKFPLLWNPHAEKPNPLPDDLSPQRFRICVTYSDISEPSQIGLDTELLYVFRLVSHGAPGGGGGVQFEESFRNLDAFTEDELFKPKYWSRNALGTDAASLGVLRFSANDPTALIFDVPAGSSLFRRPTPLQRKGVPSGLNLRVTGGHRLGNMDMDALGTIDYSDGVVEVGTPNPYLGFVVGRYPLRWNGVSDKLDPTRFHILSNIWIQHSQKLTYSLEYSTSAPTVPDAAATWVPYKQIPVTASAEEANHPGLGGRVETRGFFHFPAWSIESNPTGQNSKSRRSLADYWNTVFEVNVNFDEMRSFLDPRTARWGFNGWGKRPGFFPDPSSGEFETLRPGTAIGNDFMLSGTNDHRRDGGAASKTSLMWNPWDGSIPDKILQSRSRFELPFYDADNVLRRPMGAWVPDTTNQTAASAVGLPLAHGGESAAGADPNRFNRPIILHRPFRSVAEMSHAFSDSPWRNVDFFTPESGFTGFLDVFAVTDNQRTDSLEAGKVDLNTRQMPVLKSILAGGYRDTFGSSGVPDIDPATAEQLAEALVARTSSTDAGKGPLWNLAHLVGRFDSGVDIQSSTPSTAPLRFDGFSSDLGVGSSGAASVVQRLREAPIRVLSENGQAGTWNLLIDLVVQSGRLIASANSLDDFSVEAEKRVWVHLAIDRLTGKVLDIELEPVTE